MPLTVAIVFGLFERGVMKCGYNWARNMIPKVDVYGVETPEKTVDRKSVKCIENQIESIYYVFTFIIGTILVQQSDFLPWYLGGDSKT
mgnify:CR=1 FL=1|tara:strand:+ start:92 stop:355 length:264 start_codon:yes stop_codon:yes gene_type:complete